MFGHIIRHLLDTKQTTIKEIEEVTGRGSSTIYRWINDESDPHHNDMRLLIRHMRNPDARRNILDLLTSDLPVVINWIADESMTDVDTGADRGGHEVIERSLIRHMKNPDARRNILDLLTSDLPVVINWIADDSMTDVDTGDDRGGHEVIERSLIALDCLTHALSAGNDALRRKELTKDSYVKLLSLMNETIHHLTASKNMLNKYAPK